MAVEIENGIDIGGTVQDENPIVEFRQDSQNLIDIVEAQGMTYEDTITIIKALDLTYCPKYAYCFANDKLYEYQATSTTTPDDIDTLMPSSEVGRWICVRDFSTSVTVTKSYVDLQDAATLQLAKDYTDAYCEAGSEVNDIVSISVNEVALIPDEDKNVDITIPTKTSDLTNDSSFVVDATYVKTANDYTTAEKSKLAAIAASAQVNVIEKITVAGVEQTITSKTVAIATVTGATGKSAYEDAVAQGYTGSLAEWLVYIKGRNGTLWHATDVALVIGSYVSVADIADTYYVGDWVQSTDNKIVGVITSITTTPSAAAVVLGFMQGGADGKGITSIARTSGDGSPGTTDVYTITYTDSTTSTFNVYNGADGEDFSVTDIVTTMSNSDYIYIEIGGVAKKITLTDFKLLLVS